MTRKGDPRTGSAQGAGEAGGATDDGAAGVVRGKVGAAPATGGDARVTGVAGGEAVAPASSGGEPPLPVDGHGGAVAGARLARSGAAPGRGAAGWLLLVYRVPSEPTRLRATVWRRVRGLGAIYLQSAAATLPDSQANERALRALRREILDMGGTAVLLRCQAVAGEADVVNAFQDARNDEYAEIVDRAKDFLAQVDKEHVAQHFSYAELEENEVDLAKLQSWLDKVRRRDVLGASGLAEVEEILVECERSLEGYAAQVYAREHDGH